MVQPGGPARLRRSQVLACVDRQGNDHRPARRGPAPRPRVAVDLPLAVRALPPGGPRAPIGAFQLRPIPGPALYPAFVMKYDPFQFLKFPANSVMPSCML